jgi:hypothetical protein
MGRHGYTSQNVLALCDFDMRFNFVVAGWLGSVHDMRVFKDAIDKYGDRFPHPPEGIDLSYDLLFHLNALTLHLPYKKLQLCREVLSCRLGLPKPTRLFTRVQSIITRSIEMDPSPPQRGKKELYNYTHSSLRNVTEWSFEVLKMKWRILLDLPSYPMSKQSQIILACMALHNFVRENDKKDRDFEKCDEDENYIPLEEPPSSQANGASTSHGEEDQSMNRFRDWIADGLYSRS